MADDDQGLLGGLLQAEEPWALEETQNNIKKNWETYLSKHAKKDTKSLQEIAKNIDTLVNRGTAAEKTTLDELKRAKTANQKDSAIFNKLLGTTQKGNVRRNKNFKDLKQSVSESILKGHKKSGGIINTLTLGLADKFAGIAKGVMNFDGTMAGFAKTMGAVSGVAGAMIAWIANTTDTYKTLVNVGQTFGGDMLMMHHKANQAGISLDLLAKMTIKHSKLMAFQTKAGVSGLQLQLDTQLAVRKNIRAFGNYGLTLEQVNEFSASYLDQLRIQGRLDKMSNDARILATTNYMRKLSELSEITGKSRDVLAEEMKSANENVNQWARSMTRQGAERENFIKAMENMNLGLGMFGKESAAAFREIILQADQFSGNLALTDIGGVILSMVPDVGDAMQQMADAVSSNRPEDVAEANAALLTSLKNMTAGEVEALNMLAVTGDANAKLVLRMGQEAGALRLNAEGLIIKATQNRTAAEDKAAQERAVEGMSAAQRMTAAATNFSDVTSVTMGRLKDVIVSSLEPAIQNMVGYIGDATVALEKFVLGNKDAVDKWAAAIGEAGGTLTGSLGNLGIAVGVAATAFFGIKAVGAVKAAKALKGGGKTVAGIAKAVGVGKAAGRTVAKEAGEEIIEGIAKKGVAKTAGKSMLKSLLKKIPGIGLLMGLGFAAGRVMEGDFVGAGMEVASGTAGLFPGPGTAAGVGIDVGLAARDISREQEVGEAGARPRPGSPEANRAEREAAGGRWVTTGRGRRKWVTNEGGPEEGPGEEPVAGGMSSNELLSQLNEHMKNQNQILEGIGNATGATAKHSAKTADALGGFSAHNLQ